jgi:glycogen operon protein
VHIKGDKFGSVGFHIVYNFLGFVIELIKSLIAFRKEHRLIVKETPFRFTDYRSFGAPDMSYHGENAWISRIEHGRKSLGVMYCGDYAEGEDKTDFYIGYNFNSDEVRLALPILPNKKWTLDGEMVLEDQMFVQIPANAITVLKTKEVPQEKKVVGKNK